MRCYPHSLERLLMVAGNQVLGNCGERKTFTLVMEMWINIVNIENGMEAHQRMKTGPASYSTIASRFLENEGSMSKRFLYHPGYCRTIYNSTNRQSTLGSMDG